MRKLGVLLALSLAALLVLPGQPAVALQASVVADTSPIWQTNNIVWGMAAANGAIYAGGDFTSVRPPGAAAGTSEVARNRVAAFDASTGALLPFSHTFDNRVAVITASPDGGTIYVGGDFTTVDGVSRPRLAAFDTATGALKSWNPKSWAPVRGIGVAPDGATVYIGGQFLTFNGVSKTRLAAVNNSTGALTAWAAAADAPVTSVAVAPDGSRVFVAGYFSNLNGQPSRATGSLDPVTGSNEPWASANVVPARTGTCDSNVKDIAVDASNVYFAAEGNGGGCFDGTFAARQSDGALIWKNNCLGATQSVEVLGGMLYKGSHAHNCSANGDFGEVSPKHLLVENLATGRIGPWFPNTDGNSLGPRTMATDGTQLWVGGDFTTVNNKPQQGITRFRPSPDPDNPNRPATPTATSPSTGTVRLSWKATLDDDDWDLVYRVYRDGGTTPVYTSPPVRSTFWILPTVTFNDTGLVPGSAHTYRVEPKEAFGPNVGGKSNPSAPVTVRS